MLYRRQSKSAGLTEEVGVPLSPLIDCVFLLLIFFLVTTMLKRKETIIPVRMPDAASSLSAEAREEAQAIGLAADGRFLVPAGRDRYGAITFAEGAPLEAFLDELASTRGRHLPLRFHVQRDTPFQKTVDALDTCKLRGFTNVSVKISQTIEAAP